MAIEQNKTYLFCVLQYIAEKVWVKLEEPCVYEDFVRKAKTTFPSLNDVDFVFTDMYDARLDPEFLTEFVQISSRGVVLKIKCTTNILDISDSQSSTYTSTYSNSLYSGPSSPSVLNTLDTNILDENKDAKCNKQRSTVIDISDTTENATSDSEEYEPRSKKSKLMHIEDNIISKKEHFYDPKTGKGYIATRLSNVQRKEVHSEGTQSNKKQSTDTCADIEPVDETDAVKDAINFMKFATVDQKDNIIKKVKETFKVRRYLYLNEHFFETFPRFLDMPELIDIEFELLFPHIDRDILNTYLDYANHIVNVYNIEKQDKTLLDWDRITNSFIALTQLVPPTARGKKSAARERSTNIIKKLIIYTQSATPLNTDDSKSQPKLIAVGPNKLAIEQYFLKIDKHLILLQTRDIIKAIDYLFKAHYAFHIEYDGDLHNFWILIQHYFYKISSKCTNKIIETFTKIECAKREST